MKWDEREKITELKRKSTTNLFKEWTMEKNAHNV